MRLLIDFDLFIILLCTLIYIGIIVKRKYYKDINRLFFRTVLFIYLMGVFANTLFPIPINMFEPIDINDVLQYKVLANGMGEGEVLNIIMTVPFGIIVPFIYKFSWKKMIFWDFMTGIIIEGLQLFVYLTTKFTFRYVDINDVIFNFVGGLIGTTVFVIGAKIYNKVVIDKKRFSFFEYVYSMTKDV